MIIPLSFEKKNPTIKVFNNKTFYDIHIFLDGLTKDNITLKYINNFLILNLTLKNKYNDVLNFKRMLYINNIDINTIQNYVQANCIFLKINKI
ncbi:MAG: hypothetical protein IJO26_03750 [Clostridium sp.]|nr:hypothetical protein [Clostridium sp.]